MKVHSLHSESARSVCDGVRAQQASDHSSFCMDLLASAGSEPISAGASENSEGTSVSSQERTDVGVERDVRQLEQRRPGAGIRLSFDELYRKYHSRVVDFLLRRGVPREDARELAQDTFLRVYRGMEDFRGESEASTWILRIALNLLLNRRRDDHAEKRQGHTVALEDLVATCGALDLVPAPGFQQPIPSPEEELLDDEQRRRVRAAVETLPPRMRESVKLRQRGLKYREIAEQQGVSIETVKVQLHNAKKTIAAWLSGNGRRGGGDGP